MQNRQWRLSIVVAAAGLSLFGCTPTVKVEAPDKPIEINLNVNVKLEVQKDVKQSIAKNKDIF